MNEDNNFKGGAVRSADANQIRIDLIHPVALLAVGRTYAEGATKYGDFNWERGMPVHDLLNHAMLHFLMYLAGDRTEPHLPHAAWGALAAVASDILWPELNARHLRGPGCTLTPALLEEQRQGDAERKRRRLVGDFDHLGNWRAAEVAQIARIVNQRLEAMAAEAPTILITQECAPSS